VTTGALFETGMERGATLSPCGLYRYRLWRRWGDGGSVNFVMLNPSTADATEDDPTIRRCVRFAESWGYGALDVTNLFAWRATRPTNLIRAAGPSGPDNDAHIIAAAREASKVVAAWGVGGSHLGRSASVRKILAGVGVRLHYLKMNGTGEPSHPLYLPASCRPIEWEGDGLRREGVPRRPGRPVVGPVRREMATEPNPATRITPQALAVAARVGADLSAAVRDRAGRIAGREGREAVTEGDVGRAVEEMGGANPAKGASDEVRGRVEPTGQ
jgi:hypothetical protein